MQVMADAAAIKSPACWIETPREADTSLSNPARMWMLIETMKLPTASTASCCRRVQPPALIGTEDTGCVAAASDAAGHRQQGAGDGSARVGQKKCDDRRDLRGRD